MLQATIRALTLGLTLIPLACSSESEGPGAAGGADAVEAMNDAILALQRRPEHGATRVEVQHVLVGYAGAPLQGVTRTVPEAERLAAEIYVEAVGGADFGDLVSRHTDDRAPGIYEMTTESRRQMVQGFGDVAWRLQVGEIGVSPLHPQQSPFGWHVIKRLE